MFIGLKPSRIKFVLGHAAFALVLMLITTLLFGYSFFEAAGLALAFWVGAEFGEKKGKLKASGVFENDLGGNFDAFKDAIDGPWQLWQSLGAVLIAIAVYWLLQLLF